jgi:hypothetical protein
MAHRRCPLPLLREALKAWQVALFDGPAGWAALAAAEGARLILALAAQYLDAEVCTARRYER